METFNLSENKYLMRAAKKVKDGRCRAGEESLLLGPGVTSGSCCVRKKAGFG